MWDILDLIMVADSCKHRNELLLQERERNTPNSQNEMELDKATRGHQTEGLINTVG